jgi:hypothetical protein
VSKAGDDASVRGYHRNLLYYCQPEKLRKIDGCDFNFQEIKRSSLKRMTPNYCQFVQRLINRRASTSLVRGQVVDMDTFTVGFRGSFDEVRVCSALGLGVIPWLLLLLTMLWVLDLALVATFGPLARRASLHSSRTCGKCVAAPMMWLTRAWR